MRRTLIGILAAVVILVIGGIIVASKSGRPGTTAASSNGSSAPAGNSNAPPGQVTIKHQNLFTPSQISVQAGATVTWTNQDDRDHTVTVDYGNGPDSGKIPPGGTYSYTFTNAGSYQYHCSIHPDMRGTIVVK